MDAGKRNLSSCTQATIEVDSLFNSVDLTLSLSKAQVRRPLLPKSSSLWQETLRGAAGLVFVAHGNHCANELGRRNYDDRRDVENDKSHRHASSCEHGGLLMLGIASITLDVES